MSIDSFGFQVMSLRELLEALNRKAEENPALLDKPVWALNTRRVKMPIIRVSTLNKAYHDEARYGIGFVLERGGN